MLRHLLHIRIFSIYCLPSHQITMITEEQIKNLKPGDPLIIHGTFNEICNDGDIAFEVKETVFEGGVEKYITYCHPSCVSLPSEPPTSFGSHPKHDPCREFRKGDVAEISRYKGRAIIPVDLKIGDKVKVCENEKAGDSIVHVIDPIGRRFFVNPAFLELVTAVEELKPYSVTYDNKFYHINKHGEEASIAVYSEARHPNAKAAAEAERDRLNAEHRKEQK